MNSFPQLTIAIPTWNRECSLRELLPQFLEFRRALPDPTTVEILVSDDCSTDGTRELCAPLSRQITYFRQPEQLRHDANIWFCYQHAQGKWIQYYSDDDIPLPNLLPALLEGIAADPDVILTGFEQPLGTKPADLGLGPDRELIQDKTRGIDLLIAFTKLSTYCIRRRPLTNAEIAQRGAYLGTDYFTQTLALFEFLRTTNDSLLLVLRKTYGGSRPDFNKGFRFAVDVPANFASAVDVPGFRQHASSAALRALKADRVAVLLNGLRRHYLGTLTYTEESVAAAEEKLRSYGRFPGNAMQLIRLLQYWNARYTRPAFVARRLDQAVDTAGKAAVGALRKARSQRSGSPNGGFVRLSR